MRVLIVEDNIAVLESVALELEINGYEVLQATNGQEGLDLLARLNPAPDIIVSDIAMPQMDGYEFFQNVQQHSEWHYIPFIFLTALDAEKQVRFGKSLGVDDYLVKPFKAEDLIIAIENKLRRIADFEQRAEVRLDTARVELLNLISHELNTPLTAIYGGTEMLAESLSAIPDEVTQHTLRIVQSGTRRMKRLIDQVLLMVQLDSNQMKNHFNKLARPFDLEMTVQSAQRLLHNDNLLDGRSINIQAPTKPVMIFGIEEVISRAIAELLRNALAYSSQDVELEIGQEDDKTLLVVRDYGKGIPPAFQEEIWERFRQVDRGTYEQQGAGLGLTLVRGLMQIHGGSAYLQSEPDAGTAVTLAFPAYNG